MIDDGEVRCWRSARLITSCSIAQLNTVNRQNNSKYLHPNPMHTIRYLQNQIMHSDHAFYRFQSDRLTRQLRYKKERV